MFLALSRLTGDLVSWLKMGKGGRRREKREGERLVVNVSQIRTPLNSEQSKGLIKYMPTD